MKRHGIRLVSLALCAALVTALLPPALAWKRTGEYREGLALASDGERYGYVNVAGSLVIPLRFTAAGDFDLGWPWSPRTESRACCGRTAPSCSSPCMTA